MKEQALEVYEPESDYHEFHYGTEHDTEELIDLIKRWGSISTEE